MIPKNGKQTGDMLHAISNQALSEFDIISLGLTWKSNVYNVGLVFSDLSESLIMFNEDTDFWIFNEHRISNWKFNEKSNVKNIMNNI